MSRPDASFTSARAIGALLAASVVAAATAVASTRTAAEPPRTARGTTGAVEITSAQPLRAKALRDAASPVLVRVNALGGERYRVEYLGAVEGAFDLAPLIERTDGRAAEALPDLRVEIYSQLPPNHGTDVFGLSAPGFSLAAHYSTALGAVIVLWAAVPAVAVVRRLLRPRPAPPAPAPREPTVAERLFAIVDAARTRELDLDERARLELLVLRELRGAAGAGDLANLADAVATLRDDRHTARIVRAIEAWLHAPSAGGRAQALEEIDALRLGTPRAGGAA